MPTLRRYVNNSEYYVVVAVQRCPVTFQLTKAGQHHLTQVMKPRDGSYFNLIDLLPLIEKRWAYTNRSGPGGVMAGRFGVFPDKCDRDSIEEQRNHVAKLERHVVFRLESCDQGTLDSVACKMVQVFVEAGAELFGPIPLPTRVECYTVLRRSIRKEHFLCSHKRIITLFEPKNTVLQRASAFDVPPGIDVRIREYSIPVRLKKQQ